MIFMQGSKIILIKKAATTIIIAVLAISIMESIQRSGPSTASSNQPSFFTSMNAIKASSLVPAPYLHPITPSPSKNGSALLAWDAVPMVNNYTVYLSFDEAGTYSYRVISTPATTYAIHNLTDGIYYYAVTATNASGQSPRSNIQDVYVDHFYAGNPAAGKAIITIAVPLIIAIPIIASVIFYIATEKKQRSRIKSRKGDDILAE